MDRRELVFWSLLGAMVIVFVAGVLTIDYYRDLRTARWMAAHDCKRDHYIYGGLGAGAVVVYKCDTGYFTPSDARRASRDE